MEPCIAEAGEAGDDKAGIVLVEPEDGLVMENSPDLGVLTSVSMGVVARVSEGEAIAFLSDLHWLLELTRQFSP